ncbi:hypothetical protein ACWGPD_16880 [Streptomyces hirsutus]|uniref:hypothetical protein n=1 Tax=Streptomyces hirsutus TaxID=35620 RepID=UPI003627F5FF
MHTRGTAGLGRDTRRSPGRLPAVPVPGPGSAATAGDDQEKRKREHAAEQER